MLEVWLGDGLGLGLAAGEGLGLGATGGAATGDGDGEGEGEGEGGFGDEALLEEVREELDERKGVDWELGGLGELREEMDVFE